MMQAVFRFGGSEFWICVHKIPGLCLFPRAALSVTTPSWAASDHRDLFCPSFGGGTSDIQVLAGLVPSVALREDLVQAPPPASSLLEILVLWLVDPSPQCLQLLRASLGFSLCLCVVPVLLFFSFIFISWRLITIL